MSAGLRSRSSGLLAILAAWAVASFASLMIGALDLSPREVLSVLTGGEVDAIAHATVWSLRLPRLVLASIVGAALGVSGAALQGLFRNPLADPGLIGVTSGASLGAVLAIAGGLTQLPILASMAGAVVIAIAAFAGALSVTALTLRLATLSGKTGIVTLLLTGIAVNAGASAIIGAFVFVSTDEQLRNITMWTLGSLAGGTHETNALALAALAIGMAFLWFDRRSLDLMLLGESEAYHLGVDVEALKRRIVCLSALMVGAVTAFAGPIGFVGLVVPHMCRLAFGPSHMALIPFSALAGAVLLTVADLTARTVAAPTEIPIGILTAALGAPFFLALVARHRSEAMT